MDEALLAELRERLEAMKGELQAALAGAHERSETVELDQSAVGRVSRVDALQHQAMAQAQHRRTEQQLKTVINALARIETDRYGECLRCGDEIGLERLRARPETPFCMACAS